MLVLTKLPSVRAVVYTMPVCILQPLGLPRVPGLLLTSASKTFLVKWLRTPVLIGPAIHRLMARIKVLIMLPVIRCGGRAQAQIGLSMVNIGRIRVERNVRPLFAAPWETIVFVPDLELAVGSASI